MSKLTHLSLDDMSYICRKPVKDMHIRLTAYTRSKGIEVDDWLTETIFRKPGKSNLSRSRSWSVPGHIAIAFMAHVGVPFNGISDYMAFIGGYYATST